MWFSHRVMPNLGRWYDKSLPRIAGFNFVSQMVFLALKHLRKVIHWKVGPKIAPTSDAAWQSRHSTETVRTCPDSLLVTEPSDRELFLASWRLEAESSQCTPSACRTSPTQGPSNYCKRKLAQAFLNYNMPLPQMCCKYSVWKGMYWLIFVSPAQYSALNDDHVVLYRTQEWHSSGCLLPSPET